MGDATTTEQTTIGTTPYARPATRITMRGYTFYQIKSCVYNACRKCDGVGTLWEYGNVFNGICFSCDGTGRGPQVKGGVKSLDAITRRRAASQAKRDAIREERNAQRAEAAGVLWQLKLDQWHTEAIEMDNARSAQRYVGRVGEMVTIIVTITVTHAVETRFGVSRLIIASGGDGSTIKIFSGSKAAWSVAVGDMVTITGTIKGHEEYKGVKQTVISKPKITSI